MGLGLTFAWAVVTAIDSDVLRLSIPWGRVAVRPGWGRCCRSDFVGVARLASGPKRNILEAISYE